MPEITYLGARHLGVAFEQLRRDVARPQNILAAFALNIGLGRIGNPGKLVSYDPLMHEDKPGGMIPGCPATVLDSGWMYGGQVVLRALVEPSVDSMP